MRSIALLAAALLAGTGGEPALAQSSDEEVAGRLYRDGTAARQAGRTDEAIEALTRAGALRPDDVDTQVQLGLALFAKGRAAEAASLFRKVLSATPDYDDARMGLVRAALALKSVDEAERALAPLKRRSPDDAEVKALDRQIAAAHEPAAPQPAAGKGAASKPAPAEPAPRLAEPGGGRTEEQRLFLEGQAARKAGRFDRAIERLSDVVARVSDNVDAQVELGLALMPRRRFAEAAAAFRKALARAPRYGEARLGLARIAFYEQRPAEALRDLKALLADEPRNAEAKSLRMQVERAVADQEAAVAKAEREREERQAAAIRERARAAERRTLARAVALRKAGKFTAAEAVYRDMLRVRPRDADLLVSVGSVTAFQGKTRFADARHDFETAAAISPENDDATLGLARVDLYESKLDNAGSRIAHVLHRHPGNAEAQALSARVVLAQGEAEAAETLFRRLRSRSPRDPEILLGLGDSLRGTLHDEEARAIYREAAAVDVGSAEVAARIAQPIRPRWRLDLDGSLSILSQNGADWREGSARLGYALSERTVLSGGVEVTDRFNIVNVVVDARIDQRWSDVWTSYLRLGGSPDAVYRPVFLAEGGGTVRVRPGEGLFGATLLTLDAGYAQYPKTEVETVSPGLRQHFLDGRLWVSGRLIGTLATSEVRQTALDGTAFVRDRLDKFGGYAVRVDGRATDKLTLFVGWADAPDTSDGRVIPTKAIYGGAVYDIDETFSVKVSAAHEDRVKSYDRTSANVGLTTRF